MSGKKDSDVQLDPEHSLRASALASLRLHRQQINRIRHQLRGISSQVSPNLSASLLAHQKSQAWLATSQQDLDRSQHFAMSHQSVELNRAVSTLFTTFQDGSRHLGDFSAQINAARQRQQSQNAVLARCTNQLSAQEALLRRWQPDEWPALQEKVAQVRQQLAEESLEGTDRALQQLQTQLQTATAEAQKREAEQMRQEIAREFFALHREVQSLTAGSEDLVKRASPGLKSTFGREMEDATRWTQTAQVELEKGALLSPEADATTFRSALERLQPIYRTGETTFGALEEALTTQATQLRQGLATRLETLEALWGSAQDVLYLWFPSSELEGMELEIRRLRELLDSDRLLEIEAPAQSLMENLQSKFAGAEEMEAKHTRRLFLLDALRRVCGEMGFGEVSPPAFEAQGDRSSRICLQVDTYDKGIVTFHLSLEKIEADSCIHSESCPDEFAQISEQLQEKYGVQTAFKLADGTPVQKLITDDGARLPKSLPTGNANSG